MTKYFHSTHFTDPPTNPVSHLLYSAMSAHNSDNFIRAADLNFGNSYCNYTVLSPNPLDHTAPELFPSFGLTQLIDIPTRVTDSIRGVTTSLIDLIFCKDIDTIQSHVTLPCIADHDGVFVSFHCQIEKVKQGTKESLITRMWTKLPSMISSKLLILKQSCQNQWLSKQKHWQLFLQMHLPNLFQSKMSPLGSNDQPWVNSYTRLCSRKRIEITSFSKKLTVNF